MTQQNIPEHIRAIKHQFMAFRNGIVADTMRNAGYPYHVIFGLQLPQLSQIAKETATDDTQARHTIAKQLWEDRNVRESRLLAPYLFDPEALRPEDTIKIAEDIRTQEEADILTFRLLRFLPFISDITPLLPPSIQKALARFI